MRTALLMAGVVGLAMAAVSAVQAEPRTHVIEVSKMAFGAAPSNLHVGDTVVWRNKDMFRHTATVTGGGGFDVDLPAGGEGSTVLQAAGEIAYFCRFHPMMKAALTVAP